MLQTRTRSSRGRNSRRGAEVVEFTFVFLPLLCMLFVLVDVAWAVFAKATLTRAVRVGVRTGVTLTASQMAKDACLTDTVKGVVQSSSLGLLRGDSGLSLIKVNYLRPPDPKTTDPVTDVSALPSANAPGNIMQVSVQGFSLVPLVPRIFSWNQAPDTSNITISAFSSDRIEPSKNPPCVGTAP